jgi:hypothetical protein
MHEITGSLQVSIAPPDVPAILAVMKTITLQIACCWLGLGSIMSLQPLTAEQSPPVFTAEERRLCDELSLKNQPWVGIGWEVSLTKARARAEKEGKPVFLVVNTGNVLGFV